MSRPPTRASGLLARSVTQRRALVSSAHPPLNASDGAAVAAPNPHHAARWLILATIGLAQLMVVLDSSIVNIALPNAQSDLSFDNENRQWIVTAYALGFGSLLLLGGRLSDVIGRKPMFVAGLLGFAVASALGGAATSFELLVAARGAQGVSAALLAPAALSLLTVIFVDAKERATAFAVFAAVSGAGGAVGVILGGALTEYLSWRWCMYVNVPIAIVALLGALALLKKEPRADRGGRIDTPGTIVVVAGLVSLVYGLAEAEADGWGSATTLGFIALGVALLAVFVAIESRVAHPLLPLRVVRDRTRGGSFIAVAFVGIGFFSVFLFMTFYLSTISGFAPLKTGLAFLPLIAGVTVAAGISSPLVGKIGPKLPIASGFVLAAAGMFVLSRLGLDSGYAPHVLPAFLLVGVGFGFVIAPGFSAATFGVDPDDAGVASAMVNTAQQIGGSIGIAVLSALASSAATDFLAGRDPSGVNAALAAVESYTTAFWWTGAMFVAAAIVCGALLRHGAIETDADAPRAMH